MNTIIDHTLLKPTATFADITKLCEEAKQYAFKSVCVSPAKVAHASQQLKGSDVLVCTVVGFPHGTNTTKTKAFETQDALDNGADEIDMVINMGWVKEGRYDDVRAEIAALKALCGDKTLKVIIETSELTDEEIRKVSRVCIEAHADFVKTSTGYATHGATIAHVTLIKDEVGDEIFIKASGGVRSLEDAEAMVKAGANRIGTSNGVKMMQGEKAEGSY